MSIITFARSAAWLVATMLLASNVQAQSKRPADSLVPEHVVARFLRVNGGWPRPGSIVLPVPVATLTAAPQSARQASPPACRRGRRAFIGALFGAGAGGGRAPFVHTRWENEAANGAAAAATMVGLSAAGGAFLGLATCSR
jgi:hypothetical protein